MDAFFQRATFLTAAPKLACLPPDRGAEVAFAGRSNAGKSSAINAICHQNALARTSKTPGRTQQLIFFRLDDERRLVDLPGYGFAKVAIDVKRRWQVLMEQYLAARSSLRGLVVVMDSRHPLTEFDQQMIGWAVAGRLPLLLLLTKADKLKRSAIQQVLRQVSGAMRAQDQPVDTLAFSALNKLGVESAQCQIRRWLSLPSTGDATPVG